MSNSESTLLFIPDISGFTDFVDKTEINHSRHIISELLEIMIDSDNINMSISEIEGDAILFYKEEIPPLIDLIDQCEYTFIKFHKYLQEYDAECQCDCSACESAINLSLKFIIHKGIVQKINVKNYHKLFGRDVNLAHRLLKNSIPNDEYILITDKYELDSNKMEIDKKSWVSIKNGSDTYDYIGKFDYFYIPIKNILI